MAIEVEVGVDVIQATVIANRLEERGDFFRLKLAAIHLVQRD